MKIEVTEFKVAYVKAGVPEKIKNEIMDMNASMYNDDGNGQYPLDTLRDKFDEDSEEYSCLNDLVNDGFDYIEL